MPQLAKHLVSPLEGFGVTATFQLSFLAFAHAVSPQVDDSKCLVGESKSVLEEDA